MIDSEMKALDTFSELLYDVQSRLYAYFRVSRVLRKHSMPIFCASFLNYSVVSMFV